MQHSAEYEYSMPVMVGGGTSTTTSATSPFSFHSEVAVVAVAFGGTGYVVVSPEAGPPTGSATSTYTDGQHGLFFTGTANTMVQPEAIFWPLGQDRKAYLNISMSGGNSAIVSLIFRRRLTTFSASAEIDQYELQNDANAASEFGMTLEPNYASQLNAEVRRERQGGVTR